MMNHYKAECQHSRYISLDLAPYDINPPHTYPRGIELLEVMEGALLFDVFVFPIGLIHFQFNIGQTNAITFAGLNSQYPRLITIANTIFGSNPPINLGVLAKAFQLGKNLVDYLQKEF
ncbi:germin-like protein subfamily 1 member 13 [Quercus suber]|uniref:Germin-like protein n=1 Tax=Quercus suber TaxID=58331 RepID=A0AAW0KLD6_QUESU